MSLAAAAAGARDPQALFQLIDSRARNALSAMVKARRRAAELIQTSYPAEARDEALRALGDALGAIDGADLFARRCDQACLDAIAERLSAVRSVQRAGSLATVDTVHGDKLELYRGPDDRYGLVWNTDTLRRESQRAFAELDLIKQNAAVYDKQRTLQ